MSINKFESSDDIARQIMELPFIQSLPEDQQKRLNGMLVRFRILTLQDVQVWNQTHWEVLRSHAQNYKQ